MKLDPTLFASDAVLFIIMAIGLIGVSISVGMQGSDDNINISAKEWNECEKKALDIDKTTCQKGLINAAKDKR